jgi:hypothetical protein
MKHSKLIRVVYPPDISVHEIFLNLLRQGMEVEQITDEDLYALLVTQSRLRKDGVTKILSTELAVHEILAPTIPLPLLVKALQGMLRTLSPNKSLIVIDAYVFPDGAKPEYISLFVAIVDPFLDELNSIKFVTKPNYNRDIEREVEKALKDRNPDIDVSVVTSGDYHDRFWICDEQKGLFVGTSLNGIGKRYALADFMREKDVLEIVQSLKRNSLL